MKIEVHLPTINRREMGAVLTAMVEDKVGPGEYSRVLMQTAKEHLRFDFALVLRSPATALYLALRALGLADGDGVLVSALSPHYYAQVLADLRLTPLYCDVSSFSFPCISLESVEKAISAKPADVQARCIVLHHTLGFMPDTASMATLGIPIIEDVSQSYSPAKPDDGRETAHGVFTVLGLEERDMLTSGGGALLFAMGRRDASVLRGYSGLPPEYCLPDINAALASVQFRETERNMERRREIARVYTQASLRTKHRRFVSLDGFEYNDYAFPLVLETSMKDVTAYARKKEIVVENAFARSLAGTGAVDSALCPTSYSLSLRTVLFPLYPRLRSAETERVSRLITTLP
ncbi:MAG: DegT/DnrJ/EryC1/StrS family aminotransferase [Treponema sp.]|nr:DegT/DnrJ/EryC1/StrS family aminotransferase [Treponema sp.]